MRHVIWALAIVAVIAASWGTASIRAEGIATDYIEQVPPHDDDSVICAAVNAHKNRARWFVGFYNEYHHQGVATYKDQGDRLVWSKRHVPALVKSLARGVYGTDNIRTKCLVA